MAVHQVIVAAAPGDAITNEAFELRAILRAEFKDSEIIAKYVDPQFAGDVKTLAEISDSGDGDPGDLLVFHASIGESDVAKFVTERKERLVILYHNITPSSFFEPWDMRIAALLDEGRLELATFRNKAILALADSAFNAAELIEMGFENVHVSPLVLDCRPLIEAEPTAGVIHHLAIASGNPIVLFVGQMMPHKRPELLIETYHALLAYHEPQAGLVMAGVDNRLPPYRRAMQLIIDHLNLPNTWITGTIPLEFLSAMYQMADVFVTMSEHEGFCAPLVEAMGFDLPVIARDFGAIGETLGGAGVLLPKDAGPLLVAEAISAVVNDSSMRRELVAAGRKRVAAFDPDVARATFLDHIRSVA